jgi:hypothetical protein
MVFNVSQYWDVAIDGLQIVLCLLILVLIIRGRRKKRQSLPGAGFRGSGQNFNFQIHIQTLKHQIDQAFTNITDTIATEQGNLDNALANGGHVNEPLGIYQYQSQVHRPAAKDISTIATGETGSDQLYEQIEKLARKGMSPRQISEDLKTPLGEVELVLSLRSDHEN